MLFGGFSVVILTTAIIAFIGTIEEPSEGTRLFQSIVMTVSVLAMPSAAFAGFILLFRRVRRILFGWKDPELEE